MQRGLFIAAGLSVVVAVFSGWADYRRRRRTDLDRVGLVDWRTVQIAAIATALITVSLAANG